jgi:hypothetical protein
MKTTQENQRISTGRAFALIAIAGLLSLGLAHAADNASMIASAESAGPPSVTSNATIKAPDGTVLRKGSSSYTCYPQQDIIGPMCNEPVWDRLIDAMLNKKSFSGGQFSVSYMSAAILTMMCAYCVPPHITYTGSPGFVDKPLSIAPLGTTIIRWGPSFTQSLLFSGSVA